MTFRLIAQFNYMNFQKLSVSVLNKNDTRLKRNAKANETRFKRNLNFTVLIVRCFFSKNECFFGPIILKNIFKISHVLLYVLFKAGSVLLSWTRWWIKNFNFLKFFWISNKLKRELILSNKFKSLKLRKIQKKLPVSFLFEKY